MSDVDRGPESEEPAPVAPAPPVPRRRSARPGLADGSPSRPGIRAVRPPAPEPVTDHAPPELLTPAPAGAGRARTLPGPRRRVGPWCFVEHLAAEERTDQSPAHDVPVHPHTGLQLVTWIFSGAIEHRTSAAPNAVVRAGELSLLTAGSGASHGLAYASGDGSRTPLRAARLAALLPPGALDLPASLEHHADLPTLAEGGVRLTVAIGTACGITSPATTHRPLVCAQLELAAGSHIALPVDPTFEHGLLVDDGAVTVDDARATVAELVVLPAGRTYVRLTAGDAPTRLLILGGPPAVDETVLWWGLAAPGHEGIATARADWAAQRTRRAHGADPNARFGRVDDGAAPATAPELAGVRLRVPGPRGPRRRD
ncbi:pirin family protein [Sanguibacter hominis ATCC BAA-789]|uniref:Pirin family protein n=1 Tax=Sanguibacter hominis ATCC BAA-789 TaxID=1312740 RepID=A0A9X5FD69_9MICO|nr:pirin family protein [Sanguibacter hominis ATCC BAA-789]